MLKSCKECLIIKISFLFILKLKSLHLYKIKSNQGAYYTLFPSKQQATDQSHGQAIVLLLTLNRHLLTG